MSGFQEFKTTQSEALSLLQKAKGLAPKVWDKLTKDETKAYEHFYNLTVQKQLLLKSTWLSLKQLTTFWENLTPPLLRQALPIAMAKYCTLYGGSMRSLPFWMYYEGTSPMLVWLQVVHENKDFDQFFDTLEPAAHKHLLTLEAKIKKNIHAQVYQVAQWYVANEDRLRLGNPGAFQFSPVKNLSGFLILFMDYMEIKGEYAIAIRSPLWFHFWDQVETMYDIKVDVTPDELFLTKESNYKHSTITTLDSFYGRFNV